MRGAGGQVSRRAGEQPDAAGPVSPDPLVARSTVPIGGEPVDLSWVDEFVRQVRPYLSVREADELLILLPNQAYKLNSTGLKLLGRMLNGEGLFAILGAHARDPAKRADVHHFFCDLRALVMGCLGEGQGRRAVETVPFQRPYNLLPVLSEVALTYRCNLSCLFCYASCSCRRADAGGELPTSSLQRILDVIRKDAQVPSTSFTGGEPMLRPDIVDLVAYAKSIGLRVNLITNGTLVDADAAHALRQAGLDSAQVSLEGVTPETHDVLTQVEGSFQATLAGVGHLRDVGLPVHTNTTLNRRNLGEATEFPRLARELGLKRLSMNLIIPCGSAASARAPAGLARRYPPRPDETGRGTSELGAPGEELWVRYSEVGDVVRAVRKAARGWGVEFLWYSPTPCCIFNPVAEGLGHKGCAACDGLLSVAPSGDVLPCSSLAEPVGNLLREPFVDIWRSERARYYQERGYAHEICRGCALFELCDGACPIYWRSMGYAELCEAKEGGGVSRPLPTCS
jgi:radical SAM protein with 4Fe4S-binding SPASM domain